MKEGVNALFFSLLVNGFEHTENDKMGGKGGDGDCGASFGKRACRKYN